MLIPSTPLGAAIASLRLATAPSSGACGMLSNALHAMIAAIFARIFGRLEQIILLWQAGNLPAPPTRRPRPHATPEFHTAQPCPPDTGTPNAGTPNAGTPNSGTPRTPATLANAGHAPRHPGRHAPPRDRCLPPHRSPHTQSAPAIAQTPSPATDIPVPPPRRQARAPPFAGPTPNQSPNTPFRDRPTAPKK